MKIQALLFLTDSLKKKKYIKEAKAAGIIAPEDVPARSAFLYHLFELNCSRVPNVIQEEFLHYRGEVRLKENDKDEISSTTLVEETPELAEKDLDQYHQPPVEETDMPQIDLNKPAKQDFTRVFGVEIDDMDEGQLIGLIRRLKDERKNIHDLVPESKRMKARDEALEEALSVVYAQLDKDV